MTQKKELVVKIDTDGGITNSSTGVKVKLQGSSGLELGVGGRHLETNFLDCIL
jgi:hypothetical protein